MSAVAYIQKLGMNVGNLVRDMFHVIQNASSGRRKHFLYTLEHPPAIALDTTIVNNGTNVAGIMVDGIRVNVPAGLTYEITNTPFVELRVVQGSSIDIYAQGIYLDTLEKLRGPIDEVVRRTWL
jgi:hypothetical protein